MSSDTQTQKRNRDETFTTTIKEQAPELLSASSSQFSLAAADRDDNTTASSSKSSSKRKNSNKGRHGDPRMHRAVAARLLNPELSLLEALLEGGFTFPDGTEGSGKSDRNIFDADGVLLCQRKNQLSRRLRLAKKRQQASRSDGAMFGNGAVGPSHAPGGDSRTLQNMLLNGQLPAGNEMPIVPSHQFATPFFPGQAGALDASAGLNGGEPRPKRQVIDSNLDQYLLHTARSMGLRPDQFQALRFPNQGMYPGFPGANGMPFQQFAGMPPQQSFMAAAMDQQRGNGAMDSNNMNSNMNSAAGPNMNPQNMQMPSMMSMQQQHYSNDLNRMLLNRSLIMNAMEQKQQDQGNGNEKTQTQTV